ncbi:hypothetical protein [Roseibacillus persicicus]|uniref:Uncharacterized protein n=2 Tax=Roseibacillus persicicus TaxID=454148 RepID=A0A918U2S0_9BACT|nr:hypothetical protein GCM10007100_40320 [Roseibacillus persicicus]
MFRSLLRMINGHRKPLYCESEQDGFRVVISIGREVRGASDIANLFSSQVAKIWPDLFSTMKGGFDDYGHSDEFPPAMFFMHVGRTTPDVYMGKESSYHARFEFEREKFSHTLPFYDFFLDDNLRTVHHQPVF